jgi:hypothetical protein
MLRRVALVRAEVSEELSASFIRVTIMGELGITANVVPSSPILVTLIKEALSPAKRQFLQEPHSVTSQKTPFFKVYIEGTYSELSEIEDFSRLFVKLLIILQKHYSKQLLIWKIHV